MHSGDYEMFTDEGNEAVHAIVLKVRSLSCPLEKNRAEFVSEQLQKRLKQLPSEHGEWSDTATREAICDAFNDILGHSCWDIDI